MSSKSRFTLQDAILKTRNAIMDTPDNNWLLGNKQEFGDEEIMDAIETGIDFINYTGQPVMCFTIDSLDRQLWHILIDAAVVDLMDKMIIRKARNTIMVNDGGGVVNREGNIDYYRTIKSERERRALDKLAEYKTRVNFWGAY